MKKVYFKFINAKGQLKSVFVIVDNKTAEMVQKLPEEEKVAYLTDLYHEDMRERNYQRRIVHSDGYFGDDEDLELPDNSVDEKSKKDKQQVEEFLSLLDADDRKLLEDYYLKGMTQYEISNTLNISQKMVSKRIKNVLEKLRKFL